MTRGKNNIAFDQFQRYETMARLIGYHKAASNEKCTILELGSNEHKDLRLFLEDDDILFTDVVLTETMKNDPEFQFADGTDLQFADESFDFVVAADVFEHVSAEKRERFLLEAYRVAKKGVILCFPQDTKDVAAAENRVNTYYKTMAGEDFIWLKEHSVCGLPDTNEVDSILRKKQITYFKFQHGDITTWEKMWYCHFTTVFTPETVEYRADIDHYYNSKLYSSDVSDSNYRVFYVLSKLDDTAAWEKYIAESWESGHESQSRFLDTLLQTHINMHPLYEKNRMQQAVADKDRHIRNQEGLLKAAAQEQATLRAEYENIVQQVEAKEQHIRNQEDMLKAAEALRAEYENVVQQVEAKEQHIRNQEELLKAAAQQVEAKEQHIRNQENMLKAAEQEKNELRSRHEQETAQWAENVRSWLKNLEEKEKLIQSQNLHLEEMQQQKKALEKEFAQLEEVCEQTRTCLRELKELHAQEMNRLNDEVEEYRKNLEQLESTRNALAAETANVKAELAHYFEHYHAAIHQREELKVHAAQLELMYRTMEESTCWKMTKPLRTVLDFIKRILKANSFTALCIKGLKCLKENGFRYTWMKTRDKLRHRQNYLALANKPLYTPQELEAQRNHRFPKDVVFSIVVPLYNTPVEFLHEMIRSVEDQTYGKWELCMADGSDGEHGEVGKICRAYARKNNRIKYKKLEKNLGISGNTNACLDMASGDYIGLFDHDDLLHPAALYEVMKAICEQGADFIYTDENTFHHKPEDAFCPHFKPDYAPDTLRANNYICHFTVFKRSLLSGVGKFRPECDGSQDFDMVLRLTEKAKKIVHIPKILYYWRAHAGSVADSVGAKPYVIEAAHRAVRDHLQRVGLKGEVLDTVVPSMYRIRYEINGAPLVSILIPNCEHKADLQVCLESIYEKTTYRNFEVIVIENNSTSGEIFQYYKEIQKKWKNLKVVTWEKHFNYSAINNFGAKFAKGKHLLLLNNDVEIISPDWIQEMLMFSQRNDVGAVGAKLYYPDDTVQHAGLGLGLLTLAGHLHRHFDRRHPGYMGRLIYAQNLTGVTAACMMIRRDVWNRVKGLDETFEVAFNDVDLCMRIRQAGYLIVWTPFAELYHYESKSRGIEDTPEKRKRFEGEVHRFQTRWRKELDAGDPYFNPNFSLDKEDFTIK